MIKRYNLALPNELYEELQKMANEEQTSVLEIIKRCLKAGLVLHNINKDPESHMMVEIKGSVKELIFI